MAKYKKIKKAGTQQKPIVSTDSGSKAISSKPIQKRSGLKRFQSERSWMIDGGIFLFLIIATAILYSGDLHLGFFTVDDPGYVKDNPWIRSFSGPNLSHVLFQPFFANYSPVHLLSYMIDYAIAGPDPYVFHLSSNLWAGIVAGFVFLVAFALLKNRFLALAAALLFVFHPSHVEAVTWISSRKDIIAAAFALPCLLAYLQYRKGGSSSKWWYGLSLVLFLFAIAGKLSVATFPAVLFAYDYFVEKRSFTKSLLDKIPFLAVAIGFAFVVESAQPATGNAPDPFIYLVGLGQSLWLLTGFGSYVLNRVPPTSASMGLEIVAAIVLIGIFLLPLLLRRRFPLVVVLIYWILFTYLPSQVLSFVHPVTDRYLFMPSTALVILIVWGIFNLAKKYFRKELVISLAVAFFITMLWGWTTVKYLNEWRDPRSVWYAAVKKSPDPDVYYSLGEHYMEEAARLGNVQRGQPLSVEEKEKLADKVWKDDQRLQKLKAEWKEKPVGGPLDKEFQIALWELSEQAFKNAFDRQGSRAMPHLYYRLGLLSMDRGDLSRAKKEFLNAIDEVSRYTVIDVGYELTVASCSYLGNIALKQNDYREALKWYKLGEEKQNEFGGNWAPGISDQRKKMENMVAMMPGSNSGDTQKVDASAAFSLGLHYLNSANRLGTAAGNSPLPLEDSKRLADEVWKDNSQLSSLLAEWSAGQRGGPTEIIFQDYLKTLAWNVFEQALQNKGSAVNSNLFFRRGMILGDRGDMDGARREFMAAIKEAELESDPTTKHQVIVFSHDALGIVAWREKKYQEALQWFRTAQQEQKEFGANWIPDLESKCKQLESIIASSK